MGVCNDQAPAGRLQAKPHTETVTEARRRPVALGLTPNASLSDSRYPPLRQSVLGVALNNCYLNRLSQARLMGN